MFEYKRQLMQGHEISYLLSKAHRVNPKCLYSHINLDDSVSVCMCACVWRGGKGGKRGGKREEDSERVATRLNSIFGELAHYDTTPHPPHLPISQPKILG